MSIPWWLEYIWTHSGPSWKSTFEDLEALPVTTDCPLEERFG